MNIHESYILPATESVMCNDNKTAHDRCVTPVNYADVGLMYRQIMTPCVPVSLSCPRLLLILSPLDIFLTQNISLAAVCGCGGVWCVTAGDGLTVTNVCHYLVNYF